MRTIIQTTPVEYLKVKILEIKLIETFSLSYSLLEWKKRKTWESVFYHSYRMFKKSIKSWIYDKIILQSILLHDIVEDTFFTLEEIERKFWKSISFIIDALTKKDESKELYFEKFKNYSWNEWRILFVKLFDCIDNLETICWLTLEKQIAFVKEKKEIFLPIFERNIQSIPFDFREVYKEKINEFKDLLIINEYEK